MMIRSIGPIYAKKMLGAFGIRAPELTGADLSIKWQYGGAKTGNCFG